MISHFIITFDSQTKQFNRDEQLEQDVFSYGTVFDPDVPISEKVTYHPHELDEEESVLHDFAVAVIGAYLMLENNTEVGSIQSMKQAILDWAEAQKEDHHA